MPSNQVATSTIEFLSTSFFLCSILNIFLYRDSGHLLRHAPLAQLARAWDFYDRHHPKVAGSTPAGRVNMSFLGSPTRIFWLVIFLFTLCKLLPKYVVWYHVCAQDILISFIYVLFLCRFDLYWVCGVHTSHVDPPRPSYRPPSSSRPITVSAPIATRIEMHHLYRGL